ncbi:hypothetical protein QE152_g22354 [Popillia japonica]|uniref:Uncharacterized protein n=1 Tax=Popillia japonica TaxID=7064 RepID=A0AAW1KIY0_POPJA
MYIEDNNQGGMPMSQMAIQEKAKSSFENLRREDTDESVNDVTFLKEAEVGEEASANDDAAKEYPSTLKLIIERGGYRPEQVFNVDEI